MQELILIADPKVLHIPIKDNGEEMLNLIDQATLLYGSSPEIPNNTDYTKIRKTVYEKILQAQNLLPKGIRFCLYEGYRSLNLQKALFDDQFSKIQKLYPSWTNKQLFEETTKLVSPIITQEESKNVPPHSTGGAIDIYLVNNAGRPLEMGIHPKDWQLDIEGLLSETKSPHISQEAQKNRDIMSAALHAVDFVNYPTEYWHWSYGDRYWAYHKHQPYAIYDIYRNID